MCGSEACAATKYCYLGASFGVKCRATALAACSNLVGSAAVDDDCLCGTAKADKTKYCFAAKNVVQAAQIATCTSVDGSTASTTGVCTCGTNTCINGEKCTAASNTCAPAAPAPPPTTITQKITFSGTQSSYTGTLKTFSEQAYGKALEIFDTAATPPAYKTGCSVTSVASASRRA